jgi:hypothetical protein
MCFAVFVLLVNVSMPFAKACGRVPLLRELAAAVAFSPSLSAAVENEYVQPIGLERSDNGIIMRVEHVIVDQKQLNIFYTLQSQEYFHMDATPSVSGSDGAPLAGYGLSSGGFGAENGALRQFTLDFIDGDMPGELLFTCKVNDNGSDTRTGPEPVRDDILFASAEYAEPDFIAAFTFTLRFDPAYTQQGETIALNQDFVLDGQRLTATSVDIYPTHLRLNLTDDAGNTAWLRALSFYIENEKGKRFEAIANGITATGSTDSPMMTSFRLESAFFSKSKSLTLYITESVWLDKDMERVRVDLASGVADALPEGVELVQSVRKYGSWQLTFSGLAYEENSSYQILMNAYYDEAGKEYSCNSWSTVSGYTDEKTGTYIEPPDMFFVEFALRDYPYDTVYFTFAFSRRVTPDTPAALTVK